ncbi:mitogen-activated protein kinase kinase kinase YODA-like [Dorcoceras hygrometricum]|uniref:Mitogen-activated protein kinase kinase kinase YODA-like n=1 Tax=Dorcoceras hygrometricum TaxID=472368 RepID=A0A2Z7DDL5_9LAMI|nr:mitogen-activated protein kinase kinase kinase YODA-like [Dorcoceras hygrometricum]
MLVGKRGDVVRGKSVNEYGDGVAWFRGSEIGKGGFGRVYMATLKNPRSKHSYFPPVMAVKSAEVSVSGSIQKEREVLSNVKGSPNIIKCFGDETTMGENGMMVYNLLLEYGSGGTLAQRIKKSGSGGLPESEARVYTRSILRGLKHIHDIGYVHCDLKPDNILLLPSLGREGSTAFRAKIGDFGLAKRVKQSRKRKLGPYWRGTPMYLSPEAVMHNVQEATSDIWALGCIVLEMLTGKAPWHEEKELKAEDILAKIGTRHEVPKILNDISKDAMDFLQGCFVRKYRSRMTAEMLLNHPFVGELEVNEAIEEVEEAEGLHEIETILVVSESDYELSLGSSSDEWGYISDQDSLSYWSDEDISYCDNDVVSDFVEEVEVEKLESITNSSIDAGLSQSTGASSEVSPRKQTQFPVSFTISTGV